ncbi:MAG: LuxR C-terminal-related transcriptional regulator, partial [Sphingobacteriales bacterium]
YSRQDEKTRQVWQILSIFPSGFEIKHLEKIEQWYAAAIENSLNSKILITKEGRLFFKHELYRRTIEDSLSPLIRVCYNKKVLDHFRESFEQHQQIEQIIHHAKNANEYGLILQYAPPAARQAALVGAHIEASKLYFAAIEYYQGNDKELLVELYESYAYECYLTNQIKEAIIYQGKALNIREQKKDIEKTGNCMRFLSRLWWYEGNRKQAESFGDKAIEVLDKQPSSYAKAMAYSNISQLKMLSDQTDECIFWGEKAISIAKELDDEETLVHALNSMGSALMIIQSSKSKGIELLQQSLDMALKNSYHEHVARAYAALGSNGVTMKDYVFAEKTLEKGINYCEERDLNSVKLYMLGWKARLKLETGYWNEACSNAENLLKNENLLPVIKIGVLAVVATIKMRRGEQDALPLLLEAKTRAFETMELQRIIPALSALLEYEWITGKTCIEAEAIQQAINMYREVGKISEKSKFYFWLLKARKQYLPLEGIEEDNEAGNIEMSLEEPVYWEKKGCPYEQALTLFKGSYEDKKKAITIIQGLGANAVYEKMKWEMRASGLKSIPRGIRKSTQSNPALLTERELDVLQLLHEGMQNKEIAASLFISAKTVEHHITSIFLKLDVNSRVKAGKEASRLGIIK